MLDAPARLSSGLADDGWRSRVSRTTRPGELYYYNRAADVKFWSLEEVKAFSARTEPPGWCVQNSTRVLVMLLQALLLLLVIFGFLETCIGAFNLIYTSGAGILPWSIAMCGAVSVLFGIALVAFGKEHYEDGATSFRECCGAKAAKNASSSSSSDATDGKGGGGGGGDANEEEGSDDVETAPLVPGGRISADARKRLRDKAERPFCDVMGALGRSSCCMLFLYVAVAGVLSIAQLVLIPMTALEDKWTKDGAPSWITTMFPFIINIEKDVMMPPAMAENMKHDAIRYLYLVVIFTTFSLHIVSLVLALLLATRLDTSLAAPENDEDGLFGGRHHVHHGAGGGSGRRKKASNSKSGGKHGHYGSFSKPLSGIAKYERIYEMYGLAEVKPNVRAVQTGAIGTLWIDVRCAKPPKARSYTVKIALAHRERLSDIPPNQIKGMLVEVKQSDNWKLATVVSSAAAPQHRRLAAAQAAGEASAAASAGAGGAGAGAGAEAGAGAGARPERSFKVSIASQRLGGRPTTVVVSSESIRQRESTWEWITVKSDHQKRPAMTTMKARVKCELDLIPYLNNAGPRLTRNYPYTVAIRLEWLSEPFRTTSSRKLPPIPFACTDIAHLESWKIKADGREPWPASTRT